MEHRLGHKMHRLLLKHGSCVMKVVIWSCQESESEGLRRGQRKGYCSSLVNEIGESWDLGGQMGKG